MLVARSMGSHGGQHNFPFGYIPNELHGIGLPDFMTPGPPPGGPLLSEHDTQNLDTFLNGFDAGGDQNKNGSMQQFQGNMDTSHDWMMPPTFVGSETSLRPRNGTDWQNFQMTDFTFGSDMNMAAVNQASDFRGMQGNGFVANGQYDHNLLNQLHNAAQTMQPAFPTGWQQNFQPQTMTQVQHSTQPVIRFGSDSHFQPTRYAPPEGQFEHTATPSLDWLEAHSSAPNTQPNTEPNTQPSSPNWPKKRKLEDYQVDQRRNGFNSNMNGYAGRTQPTLPDSIPHVKRTLTNQGQPPTPTSRAQMTLQQNNEDAFEDEDADYDEEDDPNPRTRSLSPSSSSRAKNIKIPPKAPRARKKSTTSNTASRPKSKTARNSTSGPSSRVPLSADQKKANHTNSEQRRRDATARAYAELYDLVPELDEMGKQSTMKKLEIVVKKVQKVRDRVRQLRAALGFDIETGAPLQPGTSHARLAAGTARMMGVSGQMDMSSWS